MKVLLIAAQPFYTERGTPIAVRLLAQELGRLGYTVDLLTYWEGEDVDIPNVTINRAVRVPGVKNIPIGFSIRKIVANLSLLLSYIKLVVSKRYDVVHAVEETVFFAVTTKWIHKAAVIYDMDSSIAQQMSRHFSTLKSIHSIFHALEHWAIRRSDRIVVVCEDLAVAPLQIHNPRDVFILNDIAPLNADSDPSSDMLKEYVDSADLVALYVGNLESYQGIDLLVGAAAELPSDANVRILIVGGSAKDIESYRHVIESRQLSNRILLLGPRPLTQLMAYLRQADILLSPRSSGNNTPLKIYCYMAAGKPIVATEIISHTQILTNQIAVLVPPSAREIANGIVRLVRSPDLRRKFGERVRAEAESKYTIDAFRATLQLAYAGLDGSARVAKA